MRTIYLVRHGKAYSGTGTRRCIGSTDIPLDASAWEPAVCLGRWIRARQVGNEEKEGSSPPIRGRVLVASSTRVRARDTARAILEGLCGSEQNLTGQNHPDQNLILDAGFDEVHTGAWEGREFKEIRQKESEKFEERGKSLGYFRFPQGESIYDAGLRFENALNKLRLETAGDILVVSHSGAIRAFLCKLLGISLDDFMKLGSSNLSVCILMEDEEGLLVRRTAYKPADLLDQAELNDLYERYQVPDPVRAHMKKTAEMTDLLLHDLPADHGLDGDLIKKAAYVHDLMRTSSKHALRGAEVLRREGYYDLADLVEFHHSPQFDPEEPLKEKDILFYADKRVREDQIVSLEERFNASRPKCLTKKAMKKHESQYKKAVLIENKIYGKRL